MHAAGVGLDRQDQVANPVAGVERGILDILDRYELANLLLESELSSHRFGERLPPLRVVQRARLAEPSGANRLLLVC